MNLKKLKQKVLSFETQQERVNFLKEFCFKRLLEITGDEKLIERLRKKNINIKTETIENLRKLTAHKNGETEGFYRNSSKTVYIPEIVDENTIHTFVHEFMHALSHNYESDKLPEKRGLKLAGKNEGGIMSPIERVTTGLNEGATDKIAELIIGDKSIYYSIDKEKLLYFQTMCGITDDDLLKMYFQEEPWLSEKIKRNFNPKDLDAFEKQFLTNFLPGNSIDMCEDIEKLYLNNLSPETKEKTQALIQSKKENFKDEIEYW